MSQHDTALLLEAFKELRTSHEHNRLTTREDTMRFLTFDFRKRGVLDTTIRAL